jgi:nucleotide-binding universal stress UspA family protein
MATFKIKKILIPLDFSKTSLKALDYAAEISKANKAEIILLHVTEGLHQNLEPGYFVAPAAPIDYLKDFIEQSDKQLNKLAEKLKEKGITKINTLTEVGNVYYEILDVAKKNKADLIVMGTHGVSGVKEFFAGSNTFRIIRDAKCPVLSVQHKNKTQGFKNILVPFRDMPHSREKVNYAIDLAIMFSSVLNVLGIDDDFTKSHKKKIEAEAAQIKAIAEKFGVSCRTKVVSESYVGDVILNYAQNINADLIISVSDLDKTSIKEYFTGPFAQQIVNHSPIPVLSIRPKFNTDTIDLRFY